MTSGVGKMCEWMRDGVANEKNGEERRDGIGTTAAQQSTINCNLKYYSEPKPKKKTSLAQPESNQTKPMSSNRVKSTTRK